MSLAQTPVVSERILDLLALTAQPSPPKIPRFKIELPIVTLEHLSALIGPDMKAVDAVIRNRLHSDVALVRQVAEYIIHSGGKRMRPALVLLAAGALGYQGNQHHEMAAVIEFIHTATLLHDDVVDESALRRGRDTANAIFGNAASVLVGDFLYSRAFQMMVEVDDMRVMRVLSDATNIIAEGEVLQLMNCHDADVDEARYMQVIHYKTAKLFEAAAQLGAILGQASPELERALTVYGKHLGTAFQLVDDVLDYSGQEADTGKHIGDDLAEGKPTLPLIYVMQHGNAEQAACVEIEDHFHEAGIQPHDVTARGFAETRNAGLVWDALLADLLFGHADRGNFRDRVDAVRKEFRRRMCFSAEGMTGGDAALLHRGGSETRKTDDVANGVDVRDDGAEVGFVGEDAAAVVGGEACCVEVQRGG